jgi:hypothetical protein
MKAGMKGCTGCGNVFPEETFSIRTRWPDGSIRGRASWCPRCRAKKRKATDRRKARAINAVDREGKTWLPIGPWRAWLWGMILGPYRSWEIPGPPDEGVPADWLAERMGVDASRIWAWRHTATRIELDTVDRALCAAREPFVLGALYPGLFEFPDEHNEAVAA